MLDFFFYLTMILFLVVCLFMILLVLIQKGRGGGLASAFGGAGGNTAFGSKTGDVLTWATSVVFGVFLVLAVALNLLATARHNERVGVVATTPAPNTSSLPQPPARTEPGIPADQDRADGGPRTAAQPSGLTGTTPPTASPTPAPAPAPAPAPTTAPTTTPATRPTNP